MSWLLHEYFRLEHSQAAAMLRLIDRMHKISEDDFAMAVTALLSESQRQNNLPHNLIAVLKAKKLADLPLDVQQHPSIKELLELMELLGASGVSSAKWDPTIVRGLDYYTDIVFEVFDKHPDNNRSMFGGGRYDALLAEFDVEPLPSVGFGMGDVTLLNFLQGHKLLTTLPSEIDAVVILIGDVYKAAQKTLASLRAEGLKIAVDSSQRKLDAQIRSAAKAGAEHVIFIGQKELESQRFKLKNLSGGEEKELSLERLVSALASRHKAVEDL
jgi:histidyl-tRNA synthetase